MNTILKTIIYIFICTSAFSQPNNTPKLYLSKIKSDGHKLLEYAYNEKKQLLKETSFSNGEVSTQKTYSYNEKGLMETETIYKKGVFFIKYKYLYNADGLMIGMDMYNDEKKEKNPIHNFGIAYYSKSDKIKAKRKFYGTVSKNLDFYDEYEYFEGNKVAIRIYDNSKLTYTFKYIYDDKNFAELNNLGKQIVPPIYNPYYDMQKNNIVRIECYDSKGNLINQPPKSFHNESRMNVMIMDTELFTTEYQYNEANYPIKAVKTYLDTTIGKETYNFEYDSENHVISKEIIVEGRLNMTILNKYYYNSAKYLEKYESIRSNNKSNFEYEYLKE